MEGVNQGVLIPNVSLTNATTFLGGVTATAEHLSMLVYNTNTATTNGLRGAGYYYWEGSTWVRLSTATAGGTNLWDGDTDTGILVEETDDDDTIRFDVAGTETAVIRKTTTVSASPQVIIPALEVFETSNVQQINLNVTHGTAAALFNQQQEASGDTYYSGGLQKLNMDYGYGYMFSRAYQITNLRLQAISDAFELGLGGGVFQVLNNGVVVATSPEVASPARGGWTAAYNPNVIGNEVRYIYLGGKETNNKDHFINVSEFEISGHTGYGLQREMDLNANLRLEGALFDAGDQAGSAGQILTSTDTGTDWVDVSAISPTSLFDDDSDTAVQVNKGGMDDDTIRFDTAGTERMTVFPNGNVAIGVTSTTSKFEVEGKIKSNDLFVGYEIPTTAPTATGATVSVVGDYTIFTFTSDGTFSPNGLLNIEYLVVGGGGGGGGNGVSQWEGQAGGGAGGVIMGKTLLTNLTYPVYVGDGGAQNQSGKNSSIGNFSIAYGGGFPGSGGGSGGGGRRGSTPGNTIKAQGNRGGTSSICTSSGCDYGAGGGGGAGSAGSAPNGGDGIQSDISGTPTFYGGGGSAGNTGAAGGKGGGGAGGNGLSGAGQDGVDGLGGGGGGGGGNANVAGGSGGSGIVIIRYKTNGIVSLATNSGNIGIGTASPTDNLHVEGSARITGALKDSKNKAGTTGQLLSSTSSGTEWVGINDLVSLQKVTNANASITAGVNMVIVKNTTGAKISLALPTPETTDHPAGAILRIVRDGNNNGGSNDIDITGTINGSTTPATLNGNYQLALFVAGTGTWLHVE